MFFIYSIPILPIIIIILALLNAGASWIRDVLPILLVLLILKNIYVDLFYSIYKKSHNPFAAILQFIFGFIRLAVFIPILNTFLTNSGGLLGLIDLILSLSFIVPISSLLWLLGELSSLAYGISEKDESVGIANISNIISIIGAVVIHLFFTH